jgi:hypoxanthine-DNA glycosylase
MATATGFPPVADFDARVLILGTLPGVESLRRAQYYAHPANRFWWIMGTLIAATPDLAYEERLARLRGHGIALWDVCAQAERPGSLDSKIASTSIVANDFERFFAGHPAIGAIFFNGQAAATLFRRHVPSASTVMAMPHGVLPSTSPAHAAMHPSEKLARWRAGLSAHIDFGLALPTSRPPNGAEPLTHEDPMSISLYQIAVPPVVKILRNLNTILDKAAAHCTAKKIDPTVLLTSRLFPDMFAFTRQIQITTDQAKGMAARLAGVEVPSYADTEASFDDLKDRISRTVAFIESLPAENFEGAETRPIHLKFGTNEFNFIGLGYLTDFVLPNFYFHATTAYDILRHNGVDIGKRDFV